MPWSRQPILRGVNSDSDQEKCAAPQDEAEIANGHHDSVKNMHGLIFEANIGYSEIDPPYLFGCQRLNAGAYHSAHAC